MERTKQAPQFDPGDVVILKSGGPRMTVNEIEANGRLKVTWFDDKNEVRSATFAGYMLEAVPPDESPDFDMA